MQKCIICLLGYLVESFITLFCSFNYKYVYFAWSYSFVLLISPEYLVSFGCPFIFTKKPEWITVENWHGFICCCFSIGLSLDGRADFKSSVFWASRPYLRSGKKGTDLHCSFPNKRTVFQVGQPPTLGWSPAQVDLSVSFHSCSSFLSWSQKFLHFGNGHWQQRAAGPFFKSSLINYPECCFPYLAALSVVPCLKRLCRADWFLTLPQLFHGPSTLINLSLYLHVFSDFQNFSKPLVY